MRTERWQQIESTFADAARCSGDERAVFLDASCGQDPALRAEVERLLIADEQAGDFIEQAVEGGASALAVGAADPRIGRRIGPYRLIRELGRGGMSSVYLAARADDQFRKRVAIKLVRRGMDTEDVLRRFRSERQILASLDHPNIARLYDGGTTGDGQPFFVMEYIDGLPVDVYCNQHRLRVRQRLHLFLAVCSAVHYAHRNLVVHRDLKPSNVLVTTDGIPKLLDFGIAKLLNPELSEGTLAATGSAFQPMTPGYASPEQISGGTITTASDVYSLGMLLYELLAGRRPYRVDGSVEEIVRVVCTRQPERPSIAVALSPGVEEGSPGATDPVAASRCRATSPERLRRILRGDLDNLVLMALRKEPSRRYGSVEQLAGDIQSYLDGRPVIARQDQVGYRAAKFLRRHRLGAALAAVMLGLVLLLLVALAVQSERVVRERDRATYERDRANRVSAMLKDLFEIADPGEVRGNTITARELLDRGVEQIGQLQDEPETAMLLDTLARLYEELGLYGRSIPLRERSLGIYREAFGEPSAEVARALSNAGRALALRGDFARAEPFFRETVAVHRRLHGGDHPEILWSLNNLALVLHDLGDYSRAAPLYEEGLAIQSRIADEQEEAEGYLLSNRALLHHDLGQYRRAETLYREVLAGRTRTFGAEHEETAEALDSLGVTLHARGLLDEAEARMRTALDLRLRLLGERDLSVARSRTHLGRLLVDRAQPAEAEPLLRRALQQRLALMGEEHPEVAASLEGLAALYAARGDVAEAERLFGRAIEIYRNSLPAGHPLAVEAMLALAGLRQGQGACDTAEPLLREALSIRRSKLTAGSWLIAEAASSLGACMAALGRRAEARRLLSGSAAPLIAELGPEHPRALRVASRLALLEPGE